MDTIRLNSRFYTKEAVEQAIKDWKEVCRAEIADDLMTIRLDPIEDIDNLKEEFANYVLGIMQNSP